MTLELWNTFATFGTFLVIAATAIAAVVQLRHARTGNLIAALNETQQASQTPQFVAALQFVLADLPAKLEDPTFRRQLANSRERTSENQALISKLNAVGNHFENMGLLVRTGLVDKELAVALWSGIAPNVWESITPATAISRRRAGDALWENFEYLVVLSQDWIAMHPRGTYPARTRRIAVEDRYLAADEAFATP